MRASVLPFDVCPVCIAPIAPSTSVLLPACLHALCRDCVDVDPQSNTVLCTACYTPSPAPAPETGYGPHPLVEAIARRRRHLDGSDADGITLEPAAPETSAAEAACIDRVLATRVVEEELAERDAALAVQLSAGIDGLHRLLDERERALLDTLTLQSAHERATLEAALAAALRQYTDLITSGDDGGGVDGDGDGAAPRPQAIRFEIDRTVEDALSLAGRYVTNVGATGGAPSRPTRARRPWR